MQSTVQILSGAIYVTKQFAASASLVTVVLALVLSVAEVRAVSLIFPLWIGVSSTLSLTRHERQLTGHEA